MSNSTQSTISRRDFLRISGGTVAVGLLAACAPTTAPVESSAPSQEAVTIRYAGLEFMGSTVEGFLAPYFAEKGYKWERGSFGQQELEDKIMQSVATDTYLADIFQFPSNARADVIAAKALMEVPQELQDAIDWDDILPSIVRTLTWEGTAYALPYDGDIHYYSFRKDLFEDAEINGRFKDSFGYDLDPQNGAVTWQQWREIAEFFTGWDWNGNGEEDDFGIATMNKRGDTAWWGFNSRATAYAKHPDDAGYFIDTETGEARINNPGFVRALEEWVSENKAWAPPGGTNFGYGDSINAMVGGRVVQSYSWDEVTNAASAEMSVIQGKQGYNILPGSHEVYNSKTQEWETFDEPSHAPFHAFGGWVVAVSASVKDDEAKIGPVWDVVTHLTKPESGLWFVTTLTGCSPYRFSQLENVEAFATGELKLGEEVARDYLETARATLDHPNAVTDLAFPGWVQYRDALELAIAKAMGEEMSPQAALDEAAASFNEISERMGGMKSQADIYLRTMGR
jgi:multiple sugar transport system substrate-binding protein